MLAMPVVAILYLAAVYLGLYSAEECDINNMSQSVAALHNTLTRYSVTNMKNEIIFAFYCSKIAFPIGWICVAIAMYAEKSKWHDYMNQKNHHYYERLCLFAFCTSIVCLIYMYVGIEITHGAKIILTAFSGTSSGLAYSVFFLMSLYFCVVEMIFAVCGWNATSWRVRGRND